MVFFVVHKESGCLEFITRVSRRPLRAAFCGTSYSGENCCGEISLPTMFEDCFYYSKRYEMCQTFANESTVSGNL